MIYYTNHDKDLLLENNAKVYSRLTFYDENDNVILVCTEDDYLQEWEYEDYRYVPDQGFIGQFVERLLDGKLINLPSGINLNDAEFKMEIGVQGIDEETINYYTYGRFLITKLSETDTNGIVSFEASDLTKKFNKIYEDRLSYPCSAGELLEDVCDQVGVSYPADNYGGYVSYIPPRDYVLEAGNYSIIKPGLSLQETRYYNFTTTENIRDLDYIYTPTGDAFIYQYTLNNDDTYTRTTLSVTETTEPSYTLLSDKIIRVPYFTNQEFVIQNNQFEENATCRDVIKALAQLAFSWARVTPYNLVELDFTKKSYNSINKYKTISPDTYYKATKVGDTYGPVQEVIVGMSNVEGENITLIKGDQNLSTQDSKDVIAEQDATYDKIMLETNINSGKTIAIYDNPLTYTEQLRKIAVNGGANKLIGLEYTPLEVDTIGYPWLDGDDLVQVNNIDGETYYTYPFNRSISYRGYIESNIVSNAESVKQTEYKYEGEIDRRVSRTEIIVDKHEGQITAITEQVETDSNKIDALAAESATEFARIDSVTNSVTNLQTSTYTKTEIKQIVAGDGIDGVRVEKVKSVSGTFDMNGMHYRKSDAPTESTINYKGLEVNATSDNSQLLFAGYDDDSTSDTYQQSIVKAANMTVTNWLNVGNHGRFQDYEDDDGNVGVGFFIR